MLYESLVDVRNRAPHPTTFIPSCGSSAVAAHSVVYDTSCIAPNVRSQNVSEDDG